MQQNSYLENGYVNAQMWFDDAAPFIVALGGRGIGKTFGALAALTDPDRTGKFVYMRRTQAQIDACKIPELNPFKSINSALQRDFVVSPLGKYSAGVYHSFINDDGQQRAAGDAVGLCIALSVFSNIRGVDGLGYDTILYDEFIPEAHERPIRNEGAAFLNCYETLNRNRELQGQQPLKCILLSNSNNLASPILEALGLIAAIEKMQRTGKRVSHVSKAISVYLYPDSPISSQKRSSVLYTVSNNADFSSMALDNAFSKANYEYVEQRPLAEYQPLVSIGKVTVYKHKSERSFYVIEGVRAAEQYTLLPLSIKAFRRDYYYLYEALLNGAMRYSTATVKIRFEEVWKNG